jgi:hypothetical protein
VPAKPASGRPPDGSRWVTQVFRRREPLPSSARCGRAGRSQDHSAVARLRLATSSTPNGHHPPRPHTAFDNLRPAPYSVAIRRNSRGLTAGPRWTPETTPRRTRSRLHRVTPPVTLGENERNVRDVDPRRITSTPRTSTPRSMRGISRRSSVRGDGSGVLDVNATASRRSPSRAPRPPVVAAVSRRSRCWKSTKGTDVDGKYAFTGL